MKTLYLLMSYVCVCVCSFRALYIKEPCIAPKSYIISYRLPKRALSSTQKSSVFRQKSPVFHQTATSSHTVCPKEPYLLPKRAISTQECADVYPTGLCSVSLTEPWALPSTQKSPIFYPKEPYLPKRAISTPKRADVYPTGLCVSPR